MSDTNAWQRLSVREGRRPAPELSEGFTPAGTHALVYWLEGQFGYRTPGHQAAYKDLMMAVALACDIPVDSSNVRAQILDAVSRNDELMLDVLDATLSRRVVNEGWKLQEALRDAYSAWTVRDDGRALVRRVDPTADAAYRAAIDPGDAASLELSEAWSSMFGKAPNYSDAWDHAIKAMETVLVPIVAPKNPRATLGTVTAELEKGVKFVAFVLGSVETLGAMTRLAWPNPDRHGGGQGRAPEEAETSGVVHLAVTVVQWVRNGVITRQESK